MFLMAVLKSQGEVEPNLRRLTKPLPCLPFLSPVPLFPTFYSVKRAHLALLHHGCPFLNLEFGSGCLLELLSLHLHVACAHLFSELCLGSFLLGSVCHACLPHPGYHTVLTRDGHLLALNDPHSRVHTLLFLIFGFLVNGRLHGY